MPQCTHENKVYATREQDLQVPVEFKYWICPDCNEEGDNAVDPSEYSPYEILMMAKYRPPTEGV